MHHVSLVSQKHHWHLLLLLSSSVLSLMLLNWKVEILFKEPTKVSRGANQLSICKFVFPCLNRLPELTNIVEAGSGGGRHLTGSDFKRHLTCLEVERHLYSERHLTCLDLERHAKSSKQGKHASLSVKACPYLKWRFFIVLVFCIILIIIDKD